MTNEEVKEAELGDRLRGERDSESRAKTGAEAEAATGYAGLGGERSPGGSAGRRRFAIAWYVASGVALALSAAVVLRLMFHDATYELVWINSFTLYPYLPAYAVFAWAAMRRRFLLLALSVVVIGFHIRWVLPDYLPADGSEIRQMKMATAPTLRIFLANVNARNRQHEEMFAEVARHNPDVVVLVECTKSWYDAVESSSLTEAYPNRTRYYVPSAHQIAVLSRKPLVDPQFHWIARTLTLTVDVQLKGARVRLYCLHSPRPMERILNDFREFWDAVIPVLKQQPEPLIVLGDFNATQHSAVYQQLTSGRLRGVHEACGRGYATTWPNGKYWLPPIRIDHALVSPQIDCLQIREGQGEGSDHRPLVFDVRLHATPSANPDQPNEHEK